ncbi:Fic family protein [Porphyromonas endodontalis]|uniref:Fic family protein n=1 Tax=Porphyromonas endodontalis TaxID=28124 RepID=UPI0028EE16AE|nr:ATP-binding protein [Porphyromonas endodontalis]
MVTKEDVSKLLHCTETYRIERTTSTGDMDKFQEAICTFSNDLPNSRKKGYLILGARDDGSLSGIKVDDALMKKIAGIRSDGNILPLPIMSVEKVEFEEGDLVVVEVSPALVPPVRYRGRTFIRIGPRRDIASESEERVLLEKRTSYMATFDATPCFEASLKDIDTRFIENEYLPQIIDNDILRTDKRPLKEQLAAIHLYDTTHDCPTNAAIVLFGTNATFFLHGCYVQYVHFEGEDAGSEILNERQIRGSLCSILPKLESFVKDAIVTARPMPVSILREQIVFNYPELALRELLMNACMHRDYQSNMPIRIYQFSNRIEILNAGGLYGEARPENFPTVNDYRNPIIAEAMRGLKYVNMFNRGIQRVKNMLKENGNPEPKFNVSKVTAFEVTVQPSLSLNLVTDGEKVTKSATKSTELMNEVIAFCEEPRSLTEIMAHLGLKHRNNTKSRYIDPLIENGFLEMTIPDKPKSRSQKYKRALS